MFQYGLATGQTFVLATNTSMNKKFLEFPVSKVILVDELRLKSLLENDNINSAFLL